MIDLVEECIDLVEECIDLVEECIGLVEECEVEKDPLSAIACLRDELQRARLPGRDPITDALEDCLLFLEGGSGESEETELNIKDMTI